MARHNTRYAIDPGFRPCIAELPRLITIRGLQFLLPVSAGQVEVMERRGAGRELRREKSPYSRE
jgi:hypothetical protein